MLKNKRVNWWIDAILFFGFLLACLLDVTGLEVHQCLGIFLGVLAVYHLIAHLDWVNAIAERFFGGTNNRSRLYLVLDLIIFAGFFFIIGSGLLMSTWLMLPLANYDYWVATHITTTLITLAAIAIKLVLHWRWIASGARRRVPRRPAVASLPSPQPVPVSNPAQISRRQFLGVLGVVGLGSTLAAINGLKDLKFLNSAQADVSAQALDVPPEVQVPTPNAVEPTTTTIQGEVPTAAPLPSATATPVIASQPCTVRCPNGCSYPGRCRRYVDRNNNGRCDLGECL